MAGDFFIGKQAARQELERRRRALSPEQVRLKGDEAHSRLVALPFFKGSIASYAAQPFEMPAPRGALPRVVRGTKVLEFHAWPEGAAPDVGPLGILTPFPDWPVITAIDVFVVPGTGFSVEGARLGRGAGYYDATLARFPNAVKVGLTFDCCVVDRLPIDPWDVPMDFIVTESKVLTLSAPTTSTSPPRSPR